MRSDPWRALRHVNYMSFQTYCDDYGVALLCAGLVGWRRHMKLTSVPFTWHCRRGGCDLNWLFWLGRSGGSLRVRSSF